MTVTSDTQKERYQSYRAAQSDPSQIDTAAAGQTNPQPLEYRTPCEQPERESESDLCAQWRSAYAAENSAFWTEWGFWISCMGSAILLWQIGLTIEAVKDTGEATKAMREANRIAAQALDAGCRPWLIIRDLVVIEAVGDPAGFRISAKALVENVSGGIALNCKVHYSIFRKIDNPPPLADGRELDFGDAPDFPLRWEYTSPIAPGEKREIGLWPGVEYEWFKAAGDNLAIALRIEYTSQTTLERRWTYQTFFLGEERYHEGRGGIGMYAVADLFNGPISMVTMPFGTPVIT